MNWTRVIAVVGLAAPRPAASLAHATPRLSSQAKNSGMRAKNCQNVDVEWLKNYPGGE